MQQSNQNVHPKVTTTINIKYRIIWIESSKKSWSIQRSETLSLTSFLSSYTVANLLYLAVINRSILSKRFQYGSHWCRLWEKHSSKDLIICENWLILLLTNYSTTLTSNFRNVHNYMQIVFNHYTRIFVGRPVAKKDNCFS